VIVNASIEGGAFQKSRKVVTKTNIVVTKTNISSFGYGAPLKEDA
jgi:hypothetical protein